MYVAYARSSVLAERPEAFQALCVAIDKLDKIGADAVVELLTEPSGGVRLGKAEAAHVVAWLGLDDLDGKVPRGKAQSGTGSTSSDRDQS